MFIIFGLKSMIKQLMNLVYDFLHLKCIIKQLLETGFCDMQNYQCLGKSYQIINSYFDIDNSAYHKNLFPIIVY